MHRCGRNEENSNVKRWAGFWLVLLSVSLLYATPVAARDDPERLISQIGKKLAVGNIRLADNLRRKLIALKEVGSTVALLTIGSRSAEPKLRMFLFYVPARVGHKAALPVYKALSTDKRETRNVRTAAFNAHRMLLDKLGKYHPGKSEGGVEWTKLAPETGPGCPSTIVPFITKQRPLFVRCLIGAARGSLTPSGELVVTGKLVGAQLTAIQVLREKRRLAKPFLCLRRAFRRISTPKVDNTCTLKWRFPYKR